MREFIETTIRDPLVSIIISNYNYARFLSEAINSALEQSYDKVEVIVVDDGSTDDSRRISLSYEQRILPVFKENGGQASAFNLGLQKSSGEIVCFLDADDILYPAAIERTVELFDKFGGVKVHWPLWEVDESRKKTGRVRPQANLREGNLRTGVLLYGPEAYPSPPQSGNAWTRTFLERVFPLPEDGYRLGGADAYLSSLTPLFGLIRKLSEPLGEYRLHARNNYSSLDFEQKLARNIWCYDDRCDALSKHCQAMGIPVDPELWKSNSWLHRFRIAREEIEALVEPHKAFILVDQQDLGPQIAPGRRVIPFLERDGEYWGPPSDDATAIGQLERLRQMGATFIIFAWPSFWWLEYYTELNRYLRTGFSCVLENDRLIAFDLR